jgi:hypothetical protein
MENVQGQLELKHFKWGKPKIPQPCRYPLTGRQESKPYGRT